MEIINSRIKIIDKITEKQMTDYPDDVASILKVSTNMKALLYSIHDRIEIKHFLPVNNKKHSNIFFNYNLKVDTYPGDGNATIKTTKINSNIMMIDLKRDYFPDEQEVNINL